MTSSAIVIGIVVSYLVASLVIGTLPGKQASSTTDGFVAGDRNLGGLVMYFITGATIFSAFAFLGTPGWAYGRGVAACYSLAYGTLGFLPFYFIGPRAARVGRAFGFVTQAQMVATRFRFPALAWVMALISTLAFVPYLALQMSGSGLVLAQVTRGAVQPWLGAAVVYAVVLAYVLRSGVLGVGWTNTFQGIFMMALAWGMGLYLPYALYGGIGPMFEGIAEARPELLELPGLTKQGAAWTWGGYTSAILVSAIGFSFWPHLFMKAFTARDERTLRRTVVLYPTFQLFLVPLLILGFAGVMFPSSPEKVDEILPHMLMNMELSPWIVGLFCAGALAASMSSGDAIVHATASILVRDGVVTGFGRELDPATERRWIRVVLVGVTLLAYFFAMTYEDTLVGLLLYAYGPVGQLAPAVIATLYLRWASGPGVLAGLVTGIATTLALDLWPDARPWAVHAGLYGLAANVAVLVAMSLAFPAPRREEDERFFAVAEGVES